MEGQLLRTYCRVKVCNLGDPQYHTPIPMMDLILPLSSSNRWHRTVGTS